MYSPTAFDSTFFRSCRPFARSHFVLLGVLLAYGATQAQPPSLGNTNWAIQPEASARTLEPGKAIERELAGGQSHTYQVTLTAGQYLYLVVEQRGIDAVVVVSGPDGIRLLEQDGGSGGQGPEIVEWIAATDGKHRIEIHPFKKEAVAGRYEIKVAELRPSNGEDRDLVTALRELERLRKERKFDEAIAPAKRIVALEEKRRGAEHPEVANALLQLTDLYAVKKDFASAEPELLRALAIREKVFGGEHQETLMLVSVLSNMAIIKGDLPRAESLLQRILAAKEKTFGPEDSNLLEPLTELGNFYRTLKVDLVKAEAFMRRALAIGEKTLSPEDPAFVSVLVVLAGLYQAKADYPRAEPLLRRVLAIQEKKVGPEDLTVGLVLGDLATIHLSKAEYDEAEPLFRRALAIQEKASDRSSLALYFVLNNFGILHLSRGDYAQAEPQFERALAIFEKAFGPEHAGLALPLLNLAYISLAKLDFAHAEPFYQRALRLQEKAFGAEHPSTALSLIGLSAIYQAKGESARAEELLESTRRINEKAFGPGHPSTANSHLSLGRLYLAQKDGEKAEQRFRQALAIHENAFGLEHPNSLQALQGLSDAQRLKGDLPQAVASQARVNKITERLLGLNLSSGSERQKQAFLSLFSPQTANTIALHTISAPENADARDLALTTLLQRKGRGLDVMTDAIARLRRRAAPEDQKLLDQLASAQSQLASVTLKEPGQDSPEAYRAQLKQLAEQVERLESEIGARNAEFRQQTQPVTLAAVQAAIPEDAALVEFAVYAPPDEKTLLNGSPRYAAYLLTKQGEPRWVPLGEAAPIDQTVDEWRKALRNPRRADVKTLARKLDEQVMRPVRALLGSTKRVFISPDGALNLIPFAALVDERGKYLVAGYSFTYLTSGRDLLRLQTGQPKKQGAVIFANPDFGEANLVQSGDRLLVIKRTGQPSPAATPNTVAAELSQAYFSSLPGTAGEAQALGKLLPQAAMFTRKQATEAALKQIHGPDLLHIATHGFFLQSQDTATEGSRQLKQLGITPSAAIATQNGIGAPRQENPLLRSGLALTGANLRKSSSGLPQLPKLEDDGVLTALEASGLDLWGTKLVVLSACDTGVGEVKNGEGVYGLRRALVLAGSETQVMSLWPVSDLATRDLMIGYYRRLLAGEGRTEALRRVQLQMLGSGNRRDDGHRRILVTKNQTSAPAKEGGKKDRSHPYYWASFIQSGEWANLDGRR